MHDLGISEHAPHTFAASLTWRSLSAPSHCSSLKSKSNNSWGITKTTKHVFECLLKPWYLPRLWNTAKYVPTYLLPANISSYCQFEIFYKPLKHLLQGKGAGLTLASKHTENKPWQTVLTEIFWASSFVDNAQTQSVLHDIFIKTNCAYVKGFKNCVMALNMLLIGNQSKNSHFCEDVPHTACLDLLLQSVHINKPETNRTNTHKFSK